MKLQSFRGHTIPTKFGDIWSNGEAKETLFRKPRCMAATTIVNLVTQPFRRHECMYYVSKSQYPY